MSTKRNARIGDRVTCRTPERPYSSSAYNWPKSAMFVPGMHGEVINTPSCVRTIPCADCGKRHQTFLLVEFKWPADSSWMPGQWDRVALDVCEGVRS